MNRKLSEALSALCSPGDHVICALSGGADSVALLHSLLAVKDSCGITLSAAHFNHCLRGAESDADEAFVRELCSRWGVALSVGRGDPGTLSGKSPEEAARELRYAFLHSLPGLIATAHHADDQAETVLLNLIRGTGLKGLCAMLPKQGRIIRPFLSVSQAEILAYVQSHDLPYRTDSSNLRDDALRNRLRHHVIPLLQKENPNLTETMNRMTELLRQDEAFLQQQTDALLQAAAQDDGYLCSVLWEAQPVLRRRAIRQLLPCSKPSMAHVQAVEQLISRQNGSACAELPGGFLARRVYDLLTFECAEESAAFTPFVLGPNETAAIEPLNLTLSLIGPVTLSQPTDPQTTFTLCFDSEPQICVRPRQTGDRIQLSGGQKTLKKWMIDQKIPSHLRHTLPVFADDQGVLAVFGLGAAADRTAKVGEQAWILHIAKEKEK